MSSEIDICNLALSYLGQQRITNLLDPQNRQEELCALHYPIIRDLVTEIRMWTWATVRDTSTTSQRDEWGQMFSHDTPEGWLKVFRAFSSVNSGLGSERTNRRRRMGANANWWYEDGKIISENSTLFLWGVRQVVDANKFPKTVVTTMAYRLAADMCVAITENSKLKVSLMASYETDLSEAAARDGGQGRNEIIESNQLTGSRYR